ncbi:MAG: kinase [Chloroflexi bacterium]|nr:kinase [Chloroflexota bacterium]
MIISRTPYRVSFFGGGTDYPVWFREHGGAVVGTTIDKYAFITCRYLPPFFDHNHRVVYSRIELANTLDEIQHPSVQACLRHMAITKGVEIHYDGDLPARTGIGSSSAFTVGLLHALHALKGRMADRMALAHEAIHVEQDLIGENVGCQDQTFAAIGGFNRIDFLPDGRIQPTAIILSDERRRELESHLMLVYTGVSRNASEIAGELIKVANQRTQELHAMYQMVGEAIGILNGEGDIADFGKLLHESWMLKRGLTHNIASSHIDGLYQTACRAGAIGGKLLGAGGGGFLLIFCRPEVQARVKERLGDVLHVPFSFTAAGSEIIYYNSVTQPEY